MRSVAGRFIVVEGLEGAGKSTALETIQRVLKPVAPEWLLTREPGGTALGEAVRSLIKQPVSNESLDSRAELLLFYAARVQLIEQVIRPALARGAWVLADRFELSTFAYQGGGRQLSQSLLSCLSEACVGALKPDLTIYLDVSPEVGLARVALRGVADRIEQEPLSFFKRVHAAYHRALQTMPDALIIDASLPEKTVQALIVSALERYLARDEHA